MSYYRRLLNHPYHHPHRMVAGLLVVGTTTTAATLLVSDQVRASNWYSYGRYIMPAQPNNDPENDNEDHNRSTTSAILLPNSSSIMASTESSTTTPRTTVVLPEFSRWMISQFRPTTTECLWNPFSTSTNTATNTNSTKSTTTKNKEEEPSLESLYLWHKDQVVGKGTYGTVYLAQCKASHETVALKQIPKSTTNAMAFSREMRAMTYIAQKGGHPHLCALHRHFDHQDSLYYYVIMDAISGGEVFENLIEQGAYSEQDASRLIREVASALNFLHGIGLVHADLKPENLLLTQPTRGHSVVKLVDFGCAQFLQHADHHQVQQHQQQPNNADYSYEPTFAAPTPAYCPRESILKITPIQPSADMWALGIILFILLTGAHPFDLSGDATDEEIEQRILQYPKSYPLPIDNPKVTGHLSKSAKDVLSKLLDPDPDRRLTALQMLEHPWVKGETVRKNQQTTRLATNIRRFRTKLEAKFFEAAVLASDDDAQSRRQKSILYRGYQESQKTMGNVSMDLSDFSNLLGNSIIHKHFPAGHVVYRQGEKGDHMYFIESGSIQVDTKDGSVAVRHQGDFFGEGSLLRPDSMRSGTITCQTPVHVLQISREFFEKYLEEADNQVLLTLKEKNKIRRRNHVRTILSLQENMQPKQVGQGEVFFEDGETDADSLFVLETGQVDVTVANNLVFVAYPGNIIGEHSVLTRLPRNCTATCVSKGGCIGQELLGEDFRKLAEESPHIRTTLRDLQLRREFKKAVVRRLKKQFPYQRPKEAFQAADNKDMGYLDKESVATLMRELHPGYTDDEIAEILETLSLTSKTGRVTFDEFKKVFIGDKRTSESM